MSDEQQQLEPTIGAYEDWMLAQGMSIKTIAERAPFARARLRDMDPTSA